MVTRIVSVKESDDFNYLQSCKKNFLFLFVSQIPAFASENLLSWKNSSTLLPIYISDTKWV